MISRKTPLLMPFLERGQQIVSTIWNRFFQDLATTLYGIFPYLDSNKEKTVWDDLRFPATRGYVNPVNAKPDFDTSNIGLLLDPSSEEPIYVVGQLPHEYAEGTNIKPHIHYQATSSNTFPFSMRLQYVWFNINEAQPAWSNAYTTFTPTGTAGQSVAGGIVELDGTGKKESSLVKFIVTRDATNATADTYPNDILLEEFDVHFQKDKMGTGAEFPT